MNYKVSKKIDSYQKKVAKINKSIKKAKYEVARLELERMKLNIN